MKQKPTIFLVEREKDLWDIDVLIGNRMMWSIHKSTSLKDAKQFLKTSRFKRWIATAGGLLLMLNCALGLTINLIDLGGEPPVPEAIRGGGNLADIMRAAADVWCNIIRDEHTVTLGFKWENFSGSSAWHVFIREENGREVEGRIEFNNRLSYSYVVNWWLDPSPWESSEFRGHAEWPWWLFGSNVVASRSLRSPIDETGRGAAHETLTIALHEIGHALGLSINLPTWAAESADADIDLLPPLPFSPAEIPLAVNVFGPTSHIPDLIPDILMASGRNDRRTLPGLLDILAVAQMSHWTNLNFDMQPDLRVSPASKSITIEAESGLLGGFEPPAGSMMRSYVTGTISVTNESRPLLVETSGSATYQFLAPTDGDYVMSAIVRALDGSSNSVWLNIDSAPLDPQHVWHITNYTADFELRTVTHQGEGTFDNPAIVPKVWHLNAGQHTLYVVARERSCEIDKWIITRLGQAPAQIKLEWFSIIPGFELEERAGESWSPCPAQVVSDKGRMSAVMDSGGGQKFFRLRGPKHGPTAAAFVFQPDSPAVGSPIKFTCEHR